VYPVALTHQRSVVGNAAKAHKKKPSDQTRAALDAARRTFAEQKIAEYVQRTVAAAAELTAEQRSRLSALLQGGACR
jgi:hypothetical protein